MNVQTELVNAVEFGDDEKVRSLGEDGADISAPDESGRTPLHLAAMLGRSAIVEFLLRKGCDPNVVDLKGCSPLHLAVIGGLINVDSQVISSLIRYGANVYEPTDGCVSVNDYTKHKEVRDILKQCYDAASVEREERVQLVKEKELRKELELENESLREENAALREEMRRTSNENKELRKKMEGVLLRRNIWM